LLELATLASRMPSFHHDAASKLQSLMMALDEITELSAQADPMLQPVLETAHSSLRQLTQLHAANRALLKSSQRTPVPLGELVQRAAERAGVRVRGRLEACDVRVGVPAMTQALSQLLEVVAGPSYLGRIVDASVTVADKVALTFVGPPEAVSEPPPNVAEALAIATFVIDREDGAVICGGDGERLTIVLPRAIEDQPTKAP
jgi:hypothetical protein